VQTNIDDMNPEFFGYVMEKLFQNGALDVGYTPIMMKKNRPGTKVEVMCPPEKQANITRCLFAETSTIGVRCHLARRQTLPRSISAVETRFGSVQVKCVTETGGRKRYAPEFEDCRKIAIEHNEPLKVVYDAVARAVADGCFSGGADGAEKNDEPG
jgi:uncharacterized protein (DUF111 family)